MFGVYDYSLRVEHGALRIRVERYGRNHKYLRELGSSRVEKLLGPEDASILLHPVEPVNLPRDITRYLEIEFEPIVTAPESETNVFLRFPVEIGVFLKAAGEPQLIDLFSFVPPKFSLYGNPRSGVITRYYRSPTFLAPPETDPVLEGVLRLRIVNPLKECVEVSRVVLEGHSMILHFRRRAGMVATLEIASSRVAESYSEEEPFEEGMEKAIELYGVRKIPIIGFGPVRRIGGVERSGFLMEWGLS